MLAHLRQEAGRLFDERCVAALHQALEQEGETVTATLPAAAPVGS